jgi:hypothetical protein
MARVLEIAKEFGRFPAGRHYADGPYSGERFREEFLAPALREGEVELVLDGVAGLPSSFLEEAIAGLLRSGWTYDDVARRLRVSAYSGRMNGYPEQALRYLREERDRQALAA